MENAGQSEAGQGTPGASVPTEAKDLGFGSKVYNRHLRMLNPDGTANVQKLGRPWFRPYDFYQTLIGMSWWKFMLAVMAFYVAENIVFSLLYVLIGVEHLAGAEGETPFEQYLDAFFFSAQTVTTLGYGRIAPVGTLTSVVAAIESLLGVMGFALVTGLFYGRFSRPVARIVFSTEAVVAPYGDGKALMFRLVNERSSQLIEVEAVVSVAYMRPGEAKRQFRRLDLELDKVTFLPLAWTVVHPLTPDSPLYHFGAEEYGVNGVEVIVLIKAFDDSFGTTVYARRSYVASEVRWDHKFVVMTGANAEATTLDLRRLSEVEGVASRQRESESE